MPYFTGCLFSEEQVLTRLRSASDLISINSPPLLCRRCGIAPAPIWASKIDEIIGSSYHLHNATTLPGPFLEACYNILDSYVEFNFWNMRKLNTYAVSTDQGAMFSCCRHLSAWHKGVLFVKRNWVEQKMAAFCLSLQGGIAPMFLLSMISWQSTRRNVCNLVFRP